ncbi:bacterial dynamin-like protein [Saccostrea cucullata]|uniref:bacterial dynamin-like protein n=1 Tax=Saccostrea cuccullata TaxID=36930 RepID=UPI002ED3C78C
MDDCICREEEVRGMGLNELCDQLDKMDVDYSSLEDIEEIRDLVLKSINERSSPNLERRKSQVSSEVMGEMLERDARMRKIVADLYTSLIRMLEMPNFKKNLGTEMTKEYNGYISTVEKYREQLERRHCPIVVAGETGAGKSSLLNLIMGEHVLPRQVLSSTSTICQIFNSTTKRAEVIKTNGEKIFLNDVSEAKLSKYVSVDRSGESTEKYKEVNIYWPLPMLQEHATIVDTPGIGENEEMTEVLLNFLTEAVAFIYVINTTNAGGVQDDRLVRIFQKQKEFENMGRLQQFDPECAIFVCNKWDQVPKEEEKRVLEDIARKLKTHWPTRRDVNITEQMFKMSTTEDLRRADAGLGYTDKFKSLLSGIDRLVGASLERRVRRHVDWLQIFLDRLLVKVIARINATRKNQEEREQMKIEVERRLKTLKDETEDVKNRMELAAELKCKHIAEKLTDHLNNQETKNRMFKWQKDDLPDDNDLDLIKYKSKQKIQDKINSEIVQWCQENDIEGTSSHLFDLFIKECKLIKGNYTEIDQIIQGIKPPIADGNVPQATENSSDFDASKSRSIFPLQERIALAAFAPLWLPLVIGASVLALPVAIGMLVKDVIEEKQKIKHYRENKLSHILKWAEEELKCYNTDLIFSGLQQTYLKDFMSSIKLVCKDIIPKQIEADEELIENIVKESRDSQTVRQEYTPVEQKCKEIVGELLCFKLQHLSECQPRIIKELVPLGRGAYSSVLSCDAEIGQKQIRCAVKKMASPLHAENIYLHLTEAANLRDFQHENIVNCFGIAIETDRQERRYLHIFMEMCDCSLEDLVLCYGHPMELCSCNKLRRKTCHLFKENDRDSQEFLDEWAFFLKMLKGILNGLVYLHDKDFVHRDLKLSNVLVKDNTAKIADIGLSKPGNLLTGTIIGTPVTMAPEVFEGQIYNTSADIFSLGIMVWEMWYGRKVFSEDVYRDVITNYQSVKEHVTGGTRPTFDHKYPPPSGIQTFISDCWAAEAGQRPTARKLLSTLGQIEDSTC